ncbi:hypothetical protein PGO_091370 [Plasmodium gonderi]|uniref:Uncharacterized protein n=1 Tax=Plasmodium gonderi TaxID=77519 RepID=A0A1Y1JIC3_PLAGO|nr:hypothetical protein PGO_091370 [Plasmodium gonderi]GAW80937.1 hypothetical protein PGO_091370 [Plasmodium gonderi]
MSYNKNYGGQFMGLRPKEGKDNPNRISDDKLKEMFQKKETKEAHKVVFILSELRGINIPEVEDGQIFFFCTVIFDNDDVKMSMSKSNYNSSFVRGKYILEAYSLEFKEELTLYIPEGANFARVYVSYLTVLDEDGKRNIKLEGIGYTDPFKLKECHVYPYARFKLNTAVGADETKATLKMCVKCVEKCHPSVVKETEEFNVIDKFRDMCEN